MARKKKSILNNFFNSEENEMEYSPVEEKVNEPVIEEVKPEEPVVEEKVNEPVVEEEKVEEKLDIEEKPVCRATMRAMRRMGK